MTGKTRSKRKASAPEPSLQDRWTHIRELVDCGGEITIGAISGMNLCAMTASDGDQCLAMLQRRDGEDLVAMLDRLDEAIADARGNEEFIDEINP